MNRGIWQCLRDLGPVENVMETMAMNSVNGGLGDVYYKSLLFDFYRVPLDQFGHLFFLFL